MIQTPLRSDLYQLTMGHAAFHAGLADRRSVFHLFFRKHPFKGSYAIAAGIEPAMELLANLRFSTEDLHYLASITDHDSNPLFPSDYLQYLATWRFRGTVWTVPEGAAVFAHEPLMRLEGPLHDVQLVESMLLQMVNFQTLIATKANRCVHAAAQSNAQVLEFGLRRAQNPLDATRAAWIGGVAATSNLEAAARYGCVVRGTHAHLWVMAHEREEDAFQAYANAQPGNATFLVDTYDTIQGVKHAIAVGQDMRERGIPLRGIRLDSGDLAWLSQEARKLLDGAGFPNTKIVASNDLDEHLIESLIHQGAKIDVYGVGTNLVTAADQPALGGVYKMGAIQNPDGTWRSTIKLSENAIKVSIPGRLMVRRYKDPDGRLDCDIIYDATRGIGEMPRMVDPGDPTRRRTPAEGTMGEELLTMRMQDGRLRTPLAVTDLRTARERALRDMKHLHPAVVRRDNPHTYPVGIEEHLAEERLSLIKRARGQV